LSGNVKKRYDGRPRLRCENNINIVIKEIECEGVVGFIWLTIVVPSFRHGT